MRGFARRARHEDEEESVFVSMTDMSISFLLIVILLLAFFATQYDPSKSVPLPEHQRVIDERNLAREERDSALERLDAALREIAELEDLRDSLLQQVQDQSEKIVELEQKIRELEAEIERLNVPNPLEAYIRVSEETRRQILEKLRAQIILDFEELEPVLTVESDALRFQGDGLFQRNDDRLRGISVEFVQSIATRLQEILPCYTLGTSSRWAEDCNPGHALIEAVQIEGHTDSDGNIATNLPLSTRRANDTFAVMTRREPDLAAHLNFREQPVLSVAGYGDMRPIRPNDTAENKAANRRIDLRLIMYVPRRSEEIETVRRALIEGGVE